MIKRIKESFSPFELIEHNKTSKDGDEEYIYTYNDYTIYYDEFFGGRRQVTAQKNGDAYSPYIFMSDTKFKIAWGSNGATSIEEANMYVADMQKAIELSKEIMREFNFDF